MATVKKSKADQCCCDCAAHLKKAQASLAKASAPTIAAIAADHTAVNPENLKLILASLTEILKLVLPLLKR